METHIVIMAGGIGSRFWPMSTPECPKQFIDVTGCGKSLIQLTVERFKGLLHVTRHPASHTLAGKSRNTTRTPIS